MTLNRSNPPNEANQDNSLVYVLEADKALPLQFFVEIYEWVVSGRSKVVKHPMVTFDIMKICDDTDLVTNLDTKQKRLTEVSLCCRGIPRIYWLRRLDLN